jgi:amidase
MGRSAADVRTALRVTAGPDGSAARAYSWSLPAPRHDRLEDFRVGVVLDHSNGAVSDEVAALLSETVATLARAGATIVDGWPEGVHPAQQAESFGFHLGLFFAHQQGQGDFAPLSSVIEHEARRMASRAPWSSYFEDIDVFLCPVSFTPAFPHDPRPFDERTIATPEGERPYTDLVFWIAQAALPGLPSMTAPIGRTPAGLPVGAQIVGPLYEDDTPIRFAELLGDVVGGYEPPPL